MPINDIQTTNRQHAVPQNIMDVEFKIIGDLTMRQFIYLMVFGAFGYGAFVGLNNLLKWPVVLFCVLAGVAFAFLPIEERGMDEWVINFFKTIYSENQKVWRKEPKVPEAFSFESMDMVKTELITLTPTTSRRKLEDFLNKQNKQSIRDPLDIPEFAYMQKVKEAFAEVAVETPVEAPVFAPPTVVTPPAQQTTQMPSQQPEKEEDKEKTLEDKKEEEENKKINEETKNIEKETKQKEESEVKITKPAAPRIKIPRKQQVSLSPITPDQHTGRRFTNLLPKQGEIILPIRGERILKTTEEQKIEENIEEKAEQLKHLLSQLSQDENYQHVAQQASNVHKNLDAITKGSTPTPTPTPTQTQEQKTVVQAPNIQKATEPKPQPEPAQKAEETAQPTQNAYTPPAQQTTIPGVDAKQANINPLTNKPNIISGVVKNSTGEVLQGLVLIIKNEKDEPVRALKTNQLGQFSISTPLTDGNYKIETDKAKKTGLSFDIINFEASGTVIPPVEIVGK